jgi:hemin uptake protein HemP
MRRSANHILQFRILAAGAALLLALALNSYAADSSPRVQLNIAKAAPRAVESLTERGILRDYRVAWNSMAQAVEFNTFDPLEGPFAGEAKGWLRDTVASQQRSGLSQRYLNQNHQLEAVFYAPEGDVMELHDTAEYQLQVSDGGKLIHDEHVVLHFVVLMTPAADRWVIRQLQAVPQF